MFIFSSILKRALLIDVLILLQFFFKINIIHTIWFCPNAKDVEYRNKFKAFFNKETHITDNTLL